MTPVGDRPSFSLGISPWVTIVTPPVTTPIIIPVDNFRTPPLRQVIDLTTMEKESVKYQMILSPSPETPECLTTETLKIALAENAGETATSLGLYSYVLRIKNKQRVPRQDAIYWWGDVRRKREKRKTEEETRRKKRLQNKELLQKGEEITETGDVMINVEEFVIPKPVKKPPVKWETLKVFKSMDAATKSRFKDYLDSAEPGIFLWESPMTGADIGMFDLEKLIKDESVLTNLIDCFGQLLKGEMNDKQSQDGIVPQFMQSHILQGVLQGESICFGLLEPGARAEDPTEEGIVDSDGEVLARGKGAYKCHQKPLMSYDKLQITVDQGLATLFSPERNTHFP